MTATHLAPHHTPAETLAEQYRPAGAVDSEDDWLDHDLVAHLADAYDQLESTPASFTGDASKQALQQHINRLQAQVNAAKALLEEADLFEEGGEGFDSVTGRTIRRMLEARERSTRKARVHSARIPLRRSA